MIQNLLYALIDLFFPPSCVVCHHSLKQQEQYICMHCLCKLPYTRLSLSEPNPADQKFWGLCSIEKVFALIYYEKGSPFNHLIHALKYKNQAKIGLILGSLIAQNLPSSFFSTIDEIIPLPIHPEKQKIRGYNQAEWIAKGIQQKTSLPIRTDRVYKVIHNSSQTDKGVYERRVNVQNVYQAAQSIGELENKHVLLVDDVLTTGATLCSCCETLQQAVLVKISILTFALARD
ncbi:MAG: ComF family protein [Bacteroides sp.]